MGSERDTDRWVDSLLKEADIKLGAEKSGIEEIDDALRTASKQGTKKIGKPEFIGVVGDFIIVIEDKKNIRDHKKMIDGKISSNVEDVKRYAVNGAYFYADHLVKNTNYKKVIGIGVSGDEKRHKISPLFVDDSGTLKELPEVDSFKVFNSANISEYYDIVIMGNSVDHQQLTADILNLAKKLNNDLRDYASLSNSNKPLVVSGILLALSEIEHSNFIIDNLSGDPVVTDGSKIYEAIKSHLNRSRVSPQAKKECMLKQFDNVFNQEVLNTVHHKLSKTPLRYFTEFLYKNIFSSVHYNLSIDDYLGNFYSEFMSYGGGDGKNLGIVLTPKHITQLFCDLVNLKSNDVVLDPCCGTGGFLIAAMHNMFKQVIEQKGLNEKKDLLRDEQIKNIKNKQLHGIELEPYMFTIATTNMILRGDGKSNLVNTDFLQQDSKKLQTGCCATVGMMNPPYSQGKNKKDPDLLEIVFVEHLLDSLTTDARCAVIVPLSSMTGNNEIRESILKKHTLKGVITLGLQTFYPVGVHPCIAVFTAGVPHPAEHKCKFINFEDDGYEIDKHIGLVEKPCAQKKKKRLLDAWNNITQEEHSFCIETTISPEDEWLHSFYYYNEDLPSEADFDKTFNDFLTFEYSMVLRGNEDLFK